MTRMEYLPFPARAATDTSLSASDFRVLGAIAKHDRRGANGRGCFASAKTLAEVARCSLRSTERAIARLQEAGYVRSERGKDDARRMVLRVVYETIPAKSGGDQTTNTRQSQQGYPPSQNEVSVKKQPVVPGKQNSKQIPKIGEADPVETATLLRSDADLEMWKDALNDEMSIARYLRSLEAKLPVMKLHMLGFHATAMDWLAEVRLEHGGPLFRWAERLRDLARIHEWEIEQEEAEREEG